MAENTEFHDSCCLLNTLLAPVQVSKDSSVSTCKASTASELWAGGVYALSILSIDGSTAYVDTSELWAGDIYALNVLSTDGSAAYVDAAFLLVGYKQQAANRPSDRGGIVRHRWLREEK